MKPYHELSLQGQIRRLRQVVMEALTAYDLNVERINFLTIDTNTMFTVRTKDNQKFVLRIYSDEETTLRENQAEMYWLTRLIRETDLKVTEPVPRRDGEHITIISVPGVPKNRRCVLFKWIPGRTLENDLNTDNYFKYGQVLAELHQHASSLNPLPPQINPKKWDKVFYYPDEPVVYNAPEYQHLFPPDRIKLIDTVIAKANIAFEQLFASQEQQILIHGDLHFGNVHVYRGELYVIDFEDINLGYPVQDVAVTLYYGRQYEDFPAWKAAFKQGYESIHPWPAADEAVIETLVAARKVMFINYVARIEVSPEEFIDAKCQELTKFLEKFP